MRTLFSLTPRYRLDDQSPWLVGIDPLRRYWLMVNGEESLSLAIPGLLTTEFAEFRETILKFRGLTAGKTLSLSSSRDGQETHIHCVGDNCYALEVVNTYIWHIFDRETLESLLMSAHPDWQCSSADLELGRRLLNQSWEQPVAA